MAVELGRFGITVNAIAPGLVETSMTEHAYTAETRNSYDVLIPMGRFGKPEEIAAVTAFLVGEDARYVIGQTIIVDGGLVCAGVTADDIVPGQVDS